MRTHATALEPGPQQEDQAHHHRIYRTTSSPAEAALPELRGVLGTAEQAVHHHRPPGSHLARDAWAHRGGASSARATLVLARLNGA